MGEVAHRRLTRQILAGNGTVELLGLVAQAGLRLGYAVNRLPVIEMLAPVRRP